MDIEKQQFITCPSCQGTGENQRGGQCSNCAGMGLGTFYHAQFLYWGTKLNKAVIKLNSLRKSLHLVLNLSAYTIGIIGLLALAFWIIKTGQPGSELGAFAFWRVKHWLILTFWISAIADMFILYRLSEEETLKEKIKQLKYRPNFTKPRIPDNWNQLKKLKAKDRLDVARAFSYGAEKIIEDAYLFADKARHGQLKIMHLFFNLFKDNEVIALFSRLNVDGAKLIGKIKNQLLTYTRVEQKIEMASDVKETLIGAYINAVEFGQKKVRAMNIILPSLAYDKILAEIFYDFELDHDKIANVILWFAVNEQLIENYRQYSRMARFKPASTMDRAYTAVATPILNHFAHDLTVAAKWGRLDLCVNRDKEIEKIFEALQSRKFGVILVGPEGVGKNTVIGQVAQLMVKEDVPKILKDKRLVELDIARLVSGANASLAQQRLLVVIDEVARAGNLILYINNIENIMGITAGAEESLELSEVLTGALERRGLICFASVTKQNYAKYIEDKPLGNAMVKVEITEPDDNLAIRIIESKIGFFEAKHQVYFSYGALAKTVELSRKYIHDKYLPAKAIDLLENIAVSTAKVKGAGGLIGEEDVAKAISEITRVPLTKVTESESQMLLNLESKLHERMVDQEEAVAMVAASLRRARTQLRESKRPIANFLFLGPTGVGKTELAKTLAHVYFSDESYMIRLDMSEYQHPDSVNKMIGSPDGILGYLTEAVRKSPFSLILLDEFEKAHPDILNLFLQVMDDGRLTDGQGRTIDFTNSIIIATSNIGAVFIQDQIKASTPVVDIQQKLINEYLNKVLRPELINRFDGVVVFKPLSLDEVVSITKLMLNKIGKMLEAKGIGLRYEEQGVVILAKLGFDPKFGARPLRRVLQEKIENEIANKILAHEIKRRDTVVIDVQAKVQVEKGREL